MSSNMASSMSTTAAAEARAVERDDDDDTCAAATALTDDYTCYDDDYEDEIEEMVDDEPMQVAHRLFLGSIDAARNESALRRLRIGFSLALLSAMDHANGNGIVATPARFTSAADAKCQPSDANDSHIARVEICIDDALDEALFTKLPSMLTTLERMLYVATHCDALLYMHEMHLQAWRH